MSNAAEEILSAALLVLRPDTTQQRRNEASNYLTRMIQMDEANLSFVLQLITDFMDKGDQGSVPCNLNLTSFEWDGIKGLLAGLFYKRCRAGRYISNDVDVMTVSSHMPKTPPTLSPFCHRTPASCPAFSLLLTSTQLQLLPCPFLVWEMVALYK